MNALKKTVSVLCAVCITILILVSSLLAVNTYVGYGPGNFFAPESGAGNVCAIIALFVPFILSVLVFVAGLIFGKNKMTAVFASTVSILAVTHLLAPFIVSFIFTSNTTNAFTGFLRTFFTFLAMPANSLAYAFNNSVNLFLTDFGGSRVLVYIVTFITFLTPVVLTAGYLAGNAAKNKQLQEERFA